MFDATIAVEEGTFQGIAMDNYMEDNNLEHHSRKLGAMSSYRHHQRSKMWVEEPS